MGYGGRALELLEKYYEMKMINIDESTGDDDQPAGLRIIGEDSSCLHKEQVKPKKLRLLYKLSERRPERLDYLGVSFGLSGPLLKFWKKAGFLPVYLRSLIALLDIRFSWLLVAPSCSAHSN